MLNASMQEHVNVIQKKFVFENKNNFEMRKCNLGGKEQFVNYSFEVNGHGSPMNYGLLRQFCELPN